MLIDAISENFNELLQDCGLATIALLRESCGIVIVAIYAAFVLVVTVLRPKHCRAHAAGEMLNVVFAFQRGDIRASQCAFARVT